MPAQALLDRVARSWAAGAILVLLCAAVYIPGLRSLPPVDRDEARFAQASRQMFESVSLAKNERTPGFHDGGVAVPKVQDRPRLNKPPLVYWLQSASAAVLSGGDPARDAMWMYRLPAAVCATISVLLTWRLGSRMFEPSIGLLGGALLAVCPMVAWDAHQARADELLLACTTSAVYALYEIRLRPGAHWATAAWFWASVGLGVLAKGPITPMVVGLTALGFCVIAREWRWLGRTRPWVGLAIMAALLGPWVMLVSEHVGFARFWSVLVDETVGRSTGAREGHWGPPGYHAVLAAVLLWPGSMLTLTALVRTWSLAFRIPPHQDEGGGEVSRLRRFASWPRRWRARVLGRDRELFLIAWIVPAWIVFELVATKLPHYTLPMYPALALISAQAAVDAARARVDAASAERMTVGLNIWLVIGLVICCAGPVGISLLGGGWSAIGAAVVAAGVCGLLIFRARAAAFEGLLVRGHLLALGATVVFAAVTLGFVLPRAEVLWVYPRAAAAAPVDRPLACVGTSEDSVIYVRRGRVDVIELADARAWLSEHRDGVLLMRRADAAGELDLHRLGTFAGIDYAAGRTVHLDLVELAR